MSLLGGWSGQAGMCVEGITESQKAESSREGRGWVQPQAHPGSRAEYVGGILLLGRENMCVSWGGRSAKGQAGVA